MAARARALRFARDLLLVLLAAVLISFLLKTFVIRSFYIPSASMEHTLQEDDKVIVNELEPRFSPLAHGDVVVFRDPGGWLPPDAGEPGTWLDAVLVFLGFEAPNDGEHLVKRVIGLPGDTVVCCTDFGQLTVNGIPLEEPYIVVPSGASQATREPFSVTVPDDALWVMGDNRYNSADSTAHLGDPGGGFVPMGNVVGRAIVISWPISRWTWLDEYPATFRGVTPAP
ncbi:MAG: lepB [Rhodoglobus sp.]|nr:lepB [Rhodoglobus sp.]